MSFAALKPILTVLSFVVAASGGVALGARLFKRWQTADVAHVIWSASGLVGLAFFSYFVTQGYAPAQFQIAIVISVLFCVLSLYRSADRVQRRRRGQSIKRNVRLNWSITALYLAAIGAGIVALHGISPPTPNPPLASLPTWRPQAASLPQLGSEVQIEGHGVRPPRGYFFSQRQKQVGNASVTWYDWSSPNRRGGTAAVFRIRIAHASAGFSPNGNSVTFLNQASEAIADTHGNYTASGIQSGNLQGTAFSRFYWKGVWQQYNKESHGLVYLTTTPNAVITIYGTDAEPESQSTLPVFEAAALTFHKL